MSFATRVTRRRKALGVITVEFALVFPVLVAMIFGLIDAGRFIATRVMLSQAAAAGARADCLGSATGPANADQAVRDSATMLSGVSVSALSCTGTCAGYPRARDVDLVIVTVQYNFVSAFFKAFQKTMTNTSRVIC
jgi:Flp pilus assembly protein TadG